GLAGEFPGVDEESRPALPGNRRTIVGMPFAIHARAQADLTQKRDRAGLEHAGTDSFLHVGAALAFEHDAVDAALIENMREQQAGRSAADDCHLGSRRHCQACAGSPAPGMASTSACTPST